MEAITHAEYILYRHSSPSTILPYLLPRLPYCLTLFRLLENADLRPSAIYLANFPEDNLPYDVYNPNQDQNQQPFLFFAAIDLSNTSPSQQVDLFSSYDLQPENTNFQTIAESYIHELLRHIGNYLPADYVQNIGIPETMNSVLFLSMNMLYSPIFEKLQSFINWKTHDYGKVFEYILYFEGASEQHTDVPNQYDSESGMLVSGRSSTISDSTEDSVPPILLPGAENGKYTWTTVSSPNDIATVCTNIIFPRSPKLLQSCHNVGILYTPTPAPRSRRPPKSELIAWMFENLDGAGISLFIKQNHRKAGLGFLLTCELIRRAAVRRGCFTRGNGGGNKGIWWHFAAREGNIGSEKILEALGAKRMWRSVDFGLDVGKIKAFAATKAGRRDSGDMARL